MDSETIDAMLWHTRKAALEQAAQICESHNVPQEVVQAIRALIDQSKAPGS